MDETVVSKSFAELNARLRAGHESAAEQVYASYANRVVGLARARLPAKLARKISPEDVTQSAFRSFFARHRAGQFERLGGWNELWRLLAHITARKCGRKIEEYRSQRRDVGREVHLQADVDGAGDGAGLEIPSPEPTASKAAMLDEVVEVILRDLEARDRRVVELALDGWRPSEIAGEVARCERTVRRVLEKLRRQLERMRDDVG